MEEQQMQILADALWGYFHEKYLKPYLSDSVCYCMATVTTAPSGGVIGVQRPFDNAVNLPYAWSAANLAVGDTCMILVFGDFTNAIVVGEGTMNGNKLPLVWYGVSGTAAATQTKTVTIPGITALKAGLSVRIKFTNAQTYSGKPQLNVNSLGAAGIMLQGTTAAGQYEWRAGEVVDFVYDGTNWIMTDAGHASTSYYGYTKLSSSTSSTSTALAATPSAVKAAYDLASTKASVYAYTFTAADWTASGTNYVLTLAASTHNCGTEPSPEVFIKNGTAYERYYGFPSQGWSMSINTSGDITLTAAASFDGKLVVR